MQTPRQRSDYIDRRATQLAASGLYDDWLAIQYTITAEGFPEARAQLSDQRRRDRLDRVCAKAKKKNQNDA